MGKPDPLGTLCDSEVITKTGNNPAHLKTYLSKELTFTSFMSQQEKMVQYLSLVVFSVLKISPWYLAVDLLRTRALRFDFSQMLSI